MYNYLLVFFVAEMPGQISDQAKLLPVKPQTYKTIVR